MATHSSILTWKILWAEEPGGLQSMGSQRVRYNWGPNAHTHTYTHAHAHTHVALQYDFVTLPSGGVYVLPSWTWVYLSDDLGQQNRVQVVLCGFQDWIITTPYNFCLTLLGRSLSAHNPAAIMRGSPKECHGGKPHGEVPADSPLGSKGVVSVNCQSCEGNASKGEVSKDFL